MKYALSDYAMVCKVIALAKTSNLFSILFHYIKNICVFFQLICLIY